MSEPTLVQEQRKILRVLNSAILQRNQAETDAEATRNRAQDHAWTTIVTIRSSRSEAQTVLKQKGLKKGVEERLLNLQAQPDLGDPGADPSQALQRCSERVASGLDGVRKWKGLGCTTQSLIIAASWFAMLPVATLTFSLMQLIPDWDGSGQDTPLSILLAIVLIIVSISPPVVSILAIRRSTKARRNNLQGLMRSLVQAAADAEYWYEQILLQIRTRHFQTTENIAETFSQHVSQSWMPIASGYIVVVDQSHPSWHDPIWQQWMPSASMPGNVRLGAFVYPP